MNRKAIAAHGNGFRMFRHDVGTWSAEGGCRHIYPTSTNALGA